MQVERVAAATENIAWVFSTSSNRRVNLSNGGDGEKMLSRAACAGWILIRWEQACVAGGAEHKGDTSVQRIRNAFPEATRHSPVLSIIDKLDIIHY